MTRLGALILLAVLTFGRAALAGDSLTGLMQVIVTYQEYDPYSPWQKRQPETRQGYGVLIAPG